MASLDGLLKAPEIRPLLRAITGPTDDADVRRLALIEDIGTLGDLGDNALAVLTHTASLDASGYRLDIALRMAGSRHAPAIVFTDGRDSIPPTAATISERVGVAVLRAEGDCDLAELMLTLQRELAGGPESALVRVRLAHAALEQCIETEASLDELLAAASDALGAPLELREAGPDDIAVPILVEDDVEGAVCTERRGGHDETAAEIVAQLTATAVARRRAAARRAEDAPIRSRGELLTEFLLAPPDRGDRLLERMRAADLAVDGWHTAIRIEIDNLDALAAEDELVSLHIVDRVARAGLEAAMAAGGVWHRAQIGSALLLVRMARQDLATDSGRHLTHTSEQIVRRICSRAPEIQLLCGVGSTHVGPAGLRTTVAEARAALAAGRANGHLNVPITFDEVGLQRTLIEWFASDTAREAVDSLLRPIDALGPAKSRTLLQTLQAYLDCQGSSTQAAEQLHMHRNAVSYRVNRIFELLEVDPKHPETRLMLQLACRARTLG